MVTNTVVCYQCCFRYYPWMTCPNWQTRWRYTHHFRQHYACFALQTVDHTACDVRNYGTGVHTAVSLKIEDLLHWKVLTRILSHLSVDTHTAWQILRLFLVSHVWSACHTYVYNTKWHYINFKFRLALNCNTARSRQRNKTGKTVQTSYLDMNGNLWYKRQLNFDH